MKVAHFVLAVLILLLGAIHTSMSLTCKEPNEDALWFAGSGIAILFAGLFNLLVVLTTERLMKSSCAWDFSPSGTKCKSLPGHTAERATFADFESPLTDEPYLSGSRHNSFVAVTNK